MASSCLGDALAASSPVSAPMQEIDRWAGHVGKIDQDIAFELFVKHADDICAAASRALDTEPNAEFTIITADDR